MNTIGLGNALVDVLLRLENDDVLSEIGIQKGAMDMINREQMIAIRTTLAGLPRTQTPGGCLQHDAFDVFFRGEFRFYR